MHKAFAYNEDGIGGRGGWVLDAEGEGREGGGLVETEGLKVIYEFARMSI